MKHRGLWCLASSMIANTAACDSVDSDRSILLVATAYNPLPGACRVLDEMGPRW